MDLSLISEQAMELMSDIEDIDLPDHSTVRQVFMVVEVDEGDSLRYFAVSSDDRTWATEAFLDRIFSTLFNPTERQESE